MYPGEVYVATDGKREFFMFVKSNKGGTIYLNPVDDKPRLGDSIKLVGRAIWTFHGPVKAPETPGSRVRRRVEV